VADDVQPQPLGLSIVPLFMMTVLICRIDHERFVDVVRMLFPSGLSPP